MNTGLENLPEREAKPRKKGITLVMDKGLSLRETEDFLSVSSEYADIVKLGFGTSVLYPRLKEKIDLYRQAKIPLYLGGTLFEIFVARGQYEDYKRLLDKYKLEHVEVSDGSVEMTEQEKVNYIKDLSRNFTVLSEVGSKDSEKIFAPYKWVAMIKTELEAGVWKVITEAREGGNVGVFRSSGEVREGLVDEILNNVPAEKIIFEAPRKEQQVWFIKLLGTNVNLGNIPPNEVIPLETLRLGLRADTFHLFLKNR